MKCPYCATTVHVEWEGSLVYPRGTEDGLDGKEILHGECPECDDLIVLLVEGRIGSLEYGGRHVVDTKGEELIFPKGATRALEAEVPDEVASQYREATAVLSVSLKASAALSRRLLQHVLREEYGIRQHSLAKEIDKFIAQPGVPTHLSAAIDAVRNVGNFAAHPLKDTNTGEIVEVEEGEAEWLLDVLEALLDYAYVQPRRLAERKRQLNEKLKQLGKPEMKG